MKYCLSARQPHSFLNKADEIKVQWKDRDIINDFVEDFPHKKIILDIPTGEINFNMELFTMYKEKFNNFTLCIGDMSLAKIFKPFNFNYYWRYPVTTFFELRGLVSSGVSEIVIGAPLIFNLDRVKAITGDIALRAMPNLAYDAYIPHTSGIHGQWIRPEDIDTYGEYFTTFEFVNADLKTEQVLFNTYTKKEWPGNLNLLITNLNYNIDNRAITPDLAQSRINCGQRCEVTGSCHLCDQMFSFINTVDKTKYDLVKNA